LALPYYGLPPRNFPLIGAGNAPTVPWFQFLASLASMQAQNTGFQPLGATTTDATATRLMAVNNLTTIGAASYGLVVPANSAGLLVATALAFAAASSAWATWSIEALVTQGATPSTTTIGFSTGTGSPARNSGGSTWTLNVAADTTIGAISVNAAGAAATKINWLLFGSFVTL
jgi:hypothetical protein